MDSFVGIPWVSWAVIGLMASIVLYMGWVVSLRHMNSAWALIQVLVAIVEWSIGATWVAWVQLLSAALLPWLLHVALCDREDRELGYGFRIRFALAAILGLAMLLPFIRLGIHPVHGVAFVPIIAGLALVLGRRHVAGIWVGLHLMFVGAGLEGALSDIPHFSAVVLAMAALMAVPIHGLMKRLVRVQERACPQDWTELRF